MDKKKCIEVDIDKYLNTYFGSEQEKQMHPFLKKMALHFYRQGIKQGKQKCINDLTSQESMDIAVAKCFEGGEKESSDKVKPKFKVGDYIANDYCAGKVIELTDDAYLLDTEQGIPFSYEHNAHLWTIQDAKDGDVLAEDSCIFILKEMVNDFHAAITYCTLFNDGEFHDGETLHFDIGSTRPATKEQRDTLFKAIKDAGYEWDDEKKELKKIEQKPAYMVKPKFHKGDFIKHNKANIICKVISVNSGYYYVENIETSGRIELFNAEQNFHLWTLQDAKKGDVIVSGQMIILFKEFENHTDYNFVIAYAGIDISGKIQITNGHWLISNESKPATKDQRDILFQKMKEAGYEWDPEKLELLLSDEARQTVRQVEPKPVVVSSGGATSASSSRTGCPSDVTEKPVQEEWTTAYVSSKGKSPTIDISFLRAGEKVDNFTISRENARKLKQQISELL